MSTRAQIRFATRQSGQSFSEKPDVIHAQFYRHHDGYPEGLGVDIACSLLDNIRLDMRILMPSMAILSIYIMYGKRLEKKHL